MAVHSGDPLPYLYSRVNSERQTLMTGSIEIGGEALPAAETGAATERPARQAMLRGWRRRCPACGEGALFSGYLKVNDRCPVCGEDLSHHRADDGPAYLTILIVGHILGPLMIVVFTEFRPDPWVLAAIFSVGCVALSLFLLPRLKGGLIGLQWAKRMHGFGGEE